MSFRHIKPPWCLMPRLDQCVGGSSLLVFSVAHQQHLKPLLPEFFLILDQTAWSVGKLPASSTVFFHFKSYILKQIKRAHTDPFFKWAHADSALQMESGCSRCLSGGCYTCVCVCVCGLLELCLHVYSCGQMCFWAPEGADWVMIKYGLTSSPAGRSLTVGAQWVNVPGDLKIQQDNERNVCKNKSVTPLLVCSKSFQLRHWKYWKQSGEVNWSCVKSPPPQLLSDTSEAHLSLTWPDKHEAFTAAAGDGGCSMLTL